MTVGGLIDHPAHYGGDTTYEAIKVIEAWGLGFTLGNAVKYICRAGAKGSAVEDLKKAVWYVQHEVDRLEQTDTEHQVAQGGPVTRGAQYYVGEAGMIRIPDVTYAICGKSGKHGKCVFASSHQSICRNPNGLGIS